MSDMRFYRINDKNGMGGFLCPPNHPRHWYSLDEYSGPRARVAQGSHSIDYALTPKAQASPEIRAQVQRIMDEAALNPSTMWIRGVYGYFRGMWIPESGSRNASDLVNTRPTGAGLERHAAVACIREYFPDHEPRADLIADPGKGYGSWPCGKCGECVQYEAKFDKLAVASTRIPRTGITQWSYGVECPKGGDHAVD